MDPGCTPSGGVVATPSVSGFAGHLEARGERAARGSMGPPREGVGSPQGRENNVVVVSYSGKEINAKLVYYGAGLSGKTTNLEAISEAPPDTSRDKMDSMKTRSGATR